MVLAALAGIVALAAFGVAPILMLSLAAMEGMVRDMHANREALRAAASSRR